MQLNFERFEDPTRSHEFYDPTYRYLKLLGLKEL